MDNQKSADNYLNKLFSMLTYICANYLHLLLAVIYKY